MFLLPAAVFLLFTLLGREYSVQQTHVRIFLGIGIMAIQGLLFSQYREIFKKGGLAFVLMPYLCFLAFEWVRFNRGLFLIFSGRAQDDWFLIRQHLDAPYVWFGYLVFFLIFYNAACSKKSHTLLMVSFVWSAFFVAINVLPPLLMTGKPVYLVHNSPTASLWPILYHFKWLGTYIFSRFGHENMLGDVLGFGIFPAFAIAAYAFHLLKIKKNQDPLMKSDRFFARGWPLVSLYLMLGFTMFAAILLLFSRGSILAFFITLGVFSIAWAAKSISKKNIIILVGFFAGLLVFSVWAGSLKEALTEVMTVSQEKGQEGSSSYANKRGSEIAIEITKKEWPWGTGKYGFGIVAKQIDQSWRKPSGFKAFHGTANNHYLQVLAEEGAGAIPYYLFLIFCIYRIIAGLVTTKSRYKFLMGLGSFCSALMVLIHTSFHFLMDGFAVGVLVFSALGMSLGVLNKTFQHDA